MTANLSQGGPQNTTVANMSNAQSSHGPSLIVQSQPMEMSTNSQPLQVTQQPSTTPMQISEPRQPRRKTAAIKIIDPNTGHEVVVNNPSQAPVSFLIYIYIY
jgi:translation initiation factor 4G